MNPVVAENPQRAARFCLMSWSLYERVLKDPKNVCLIDERGDPKQFKALMSLAHPEIYTQIWKRVSKTQMKKALDIINEPEWANRLVVFLENGHAERIV